MTNDPRAELRAAWDGLMAVHRPGSLGAGDDREPPSAVHASLDELADPVHLIGDLGDQDHVGARGEPRVQGDPAAVPTHDLADHDPVVAHGGGVQPVQGVGGGRDRGQKPEGEVRAQDVVVDGLGDADAGDTRLDERRRAGHRAVAPHHDQGVELVVLHVFQARAGHVGEHWIALLVVTDVVVGGVAAVVGAEDRAPAGEDPRDVQADLRGVN